MVSFSDFAGSYLKGSDLQGQEHTVTITKIVPEDVGDDDTKLVAHFYNRRKTLPLNKGNIAILQAFGDDPVNCVGRQVILYPEATRTPQGLPAIGVRIRLPQIAPSPPPPPPQYAQAAPPPPPPPPPPQGATFAPNARERTEQSAPAPIVPPAPALDPEDEIPF